MRLRVLVSFAVGFAFAGCSPGGSSDAGVDPDSGMHGDGGFDGGTDHDAGTDGGVEDAGWDAGTDAGLRPFTVCTSCDCGLDAGQVIQLLPRWPGFGMQSIEHEQLSAPTVSYGYDGNGNMQTTIGFTADGGVIKVLMPPPLGLSPALLANGASWSTQVFDVFDWTDIDGTISSGGELQLLSHSGEHAPDELPFLAPVTAYGVDLDAGTVSIEIDGQTLVAAFNQTIAFDRAGVPWCLATGWAGPELGVTLSNWAIYPLGAVVRLEP